MLEPHVFALAEAAYRHIKDTDRNQVMLFCPFDYYVIINEMENFSTTVKLFVHCDIYRK